MLNLQRQIKQKLHFLESQLHSEEEKFRRSVVTKSKYLHALQDGGCNSMTNIATGIINKWEMFNNDQQKEFAVAIAKSSDRMVNLINNMLDLAHLNDPEFRLNVQPINIISLLKSKLREYRLIYQLKKDTYFILEDAQVPIINCSKYYIRRMLDILVTNIVNHIDHGTIKITVKSILESASNIQFTVDILGVGSVPIIQEIKNLTNNPARKDNIDAILVKQIIELHGGIIQPNILDIGSDKLIFTLLL